MECGVNIITVKAGTKFSAEHVNRIFRMAKRNISQPFSFYCLTDDPTDINSSVKVISLDLSLQLDKWWWKMCIFQPNLFERKVNLYLDLDVVIQNNLDRFISHSSDKLMLADRTYKDGWENTTIATDDPEITIEIFNCSTKAYYNSSVMLWNNNAQEHLWNDFYPQMHIMMNRYHGIDRMLSYEYNTNNFVQVPDKTLYYRLTGDLVEYLPHTGVVQSLEFSHLGQAVYYYPEYLIAVFNSCHQHHFYKDHAIYLL